MYPNSPDCLYTDEPATAAVALAGPQPRPTCSNRNLLKKLFGKYKKKKKNLFNGDDEGDCLLISSLSIRH